MDNTPHASAKGKPMTPTESTLFQSLLQQQRKDLLALRSTLRGGDVGRVQASAEHFARSQGSEAQRATERDLELALDDHETQELLAIDAALARISAGTYGECVDCGADIAPERLRAAPAALRCLRCQQQAEQEA